MRISARIQWFGPTTSSLAFVFKSVTSWAKISLKNIEMRLPDSIPEV
jgi:hypothetical protein